MISNIVSINQPSTFADICDNHPELDYSNDRGLAYSISYRSTARGLVCILLS